jgi:hypothetical protein
VHHLSNLAGNSGEDLRRLRARATRVATRRSAACSAASRSISARAWRLAIAVAISSVKMARRSRARLFWVL